MTSPSGNFDRLATATIDAAADPPTQRQVRDGLRSLDEISEDTYSPFAPEGTLVAIGGYKPEVKLWRGFVDVVADPEGNNPYNEGSVGEQLEHFKLQLEVSGTGEMELIDGEDTTAAGVYEYGVGTPQLNGVTLPDSVVVKGKEPGHVQIKLTLLSPDGGSLGTDSIDLYVYDLDLVIDHDNDNGLEPPLDNVENEPEPDESQLPIYKWIGAHDFDLDNDEVPDFADGYNVDQLGGTLDDQISGASGRVFTPVLVRVASQIDVNRAQIEFNFLDAHPSLVDRYGPGYVNARLDAYDTLTSGLIRVWTRDGQSPYGGQRNKHEAVGGQAGHYLGAGPIRFPLNSVVGSGAPSQNGYRTGVVYVEGLNAGTTGVAARLLPYGDAIAESEADADVVQVRVAKIDADVDSDNNNGLDPNWPRTAWEDTIENDDDRTGKLVNVNDGDVDADETVDYADGFDLRPNMSMAPGSAANMEWSIISTTTWDEYSRSCGTMTARTVPRSLITMCSAMSPKSSLQ